MKTVSLLKIGVEACGTPSVQIQHVIPWFPLGLENLEKMGEHFPVKEKSGNFAKTGKVREIQGILPKILEKSEKLY